MNRHWHILGAGAIGHLFAWRLGQTGATATLLQRPANDPRRCHTLLRPDAGRLSVQFRYAGTTERTPIALLLVTTKANQALAAIEAVADRLETGATILLLHNGMGIASRLAKCRPQQRIALGTTTEAAYWQSANTLVHAGYGETRLGLADGSEPPRWYEDWRALGGDAGWCEDIEKALWEKLLINCAINPLTALYQCRNGTLTEDPQLRQTVAALCRELAAVSLAKGENISSGELEQRVREVIAATASNYSSMMRDFQLQRPSELEFITGYLVHEAGLLDVPCPLNQSVLRKLRALHAHSDA